VEHAIYDKIKPLHDAYSFMILNIETGEIFVHMNEKWVGLWRVNGRELVAVKKTELFSEDLSQVAKIATVADPQQAGNSWRNVEHARDANYLNLHVAVMKM
jgi:hypothetical protein